MKMGKKSGAEGMSEMTLWSAGDKNEERKAVVAKETRNNSALDSGRVALIETINDNQTSRSRRIEISHLKRFTKRLDNEGSDLGFEVSTEDESVSLNGGNYLLSCPRDVDRDLVGIRDLELLRAESGQEKKKLARSSLSKSQRSAIL